MPLYISCRIGEKLPNRLQCWSSSWHQPYPVHFVVPMFCFLCQMPFWERCLFLLLHRFENVHVSCMDGQMVHFATFDFSHQLLLTLGHPQRHHRNNATTSCMEINNQHHRYCVHRGIAIIVVASTSCEHVIVEGSK